MRRPGKKEAYYPDGYKEEYMNKEIDKKDLEEVNGGFGEYFNEIFENAQTPGEQFRDATTNPDAKKEKGSYKKTR